MPTPVPFDFDAAVPISAADLQSAVAGFMGLSIVGGILVWKIGIRLGPQLLATIGRVLGRR
ncbi:MAG: hypothetical protein HY868_16680 [Chloroflexi bacterium]|nr:hypothetical protein [Chloroflexota bacterium]